MKTKRVKASTSKAAVAQRKKLFAKEVIRNGGNGTQAAIAVGYSEHSARTIGSRLSTEVDIKAAVQAARAKMLAAADVTTERTVLELARLAYLDPRRLFRPDGTRIPIHELDDDVAAALSGFDHDEVTHGRGKSRTVIGRSTKYRFADKGGALDKLAKIQGAYEQDNRQKRPDLSIQIAIVAPTPKIIED